VISQSRYIQIISGVGGGTPAPQRQLILRLVTQNTLLPPGIVIQFSSLASVQAYFGVNSEEAARATFYFGFVNKSISSPQMISFTRWQNVASAPVIVGDATAKVLATFTAVSAGTMTIAHTVSGVTTNVSITALNFSTATSLTQVASILQTALRANADTQLAASTVTFNTNTNQFVLTGGVVNTDTLAAVPTGLTTDVSQILGLATSGAVAVPGMAAQTAAAAIIASAAISNNFGSFAYMTGLATPLVASDWTAIAQWNTSQNLMYMYCVPATINTVSAVAAAIGTNAGCAITLLNPNMPNDFAEQCPTEILASTNYQAQANATQNYMWYQFPGRNTVVSDDTTANNMDTLRANYIGVTQVAGQALQFYQRGILTGTGTAPTDMNTYANEQWFKSYVSALLFQFFLSVPEVPANAVGKGMLLTILQSAITQAITNGVISAGKILTATQQVYITQVTGDTNAWRQVQTSGFWLNIYFTSAINSQTGLTEFTANYQIVYSKKDDVRTVSGSHVMI
jgi:hypothetical protein